MRVTLIFAAVWAASYLTIAGLLAIVVSIEVIRDMRGKWPVLTAWQWAAVPLIFVRHGMVHGLRWPYYYWVQQKRIRTLHRDIQMAARRLGIT